jgi:hypothetical protein
MIKTKSDTFLIDIETLCIEKRINYIDAVIEWCAIHNLEVELTADLIKNNAVVLSKIRLEAENLNFIKKITRLPI